MRQIGIFFHHDDEEQVVRIQSELNKAGLSVDIYLSTTVLKVSQGNQNLIKPKNPLIHIVTNTECIIVIISQSFLSHPQSIGQLNAAASYLKTMGATSKLLIPIKIGDFDSSNIEGILAGYPLIRFSGPLNDLVEDILERYSKFVGKKQAIEDRGNQVKKIIKQNTAEYINDAQLKRRASFNIAVAVIAYFIAGVCIVLAIIFATDGFNLLFQELGKIVDNPKEAKPISIHLHWYFSLLLLKGFIIVGILLVTARYSVRVAKLFLHESVRNYDKIQAIYFGNFYLKAYGDKLKDSKEVIEIFQQGNMGNTSSAFHQINTENHQPDHKIEKLSELVKSGFEKLESIKDSFAGKKE